MPWALPSSSGPTVRRIRDLPLVAQVIEPTCSGSHRRAREPSGRGADVSLEVPGEMRLIVEADTHGHLRDRLTLQQAATRRVDAATEQVAMRRDAERSGEASHQMRGRHVEDALRLPQRQRLEPMLVEEVAEIGRNEVRRSAEVARRIDPRDGPGAALPRRPAWPRPRMAPPAPPARRGAHGFPGRAQDPRCRDRRRPGRSTVHPGHRCRRTGHACGTPRCRLPGHRARRAAGGSSPSSRLHRDAWPRGRTGSPPGRR